MNQDNDIDFNSEYDPYVFKKPDAEYEIQLTPIGEYIKQAATYVSKVNKIDFNTAVNEVKNILKPAGAKNPIVTYNNKEENGDMVVTTDTLTEYIKSVLRSGDVLVPSFTTYMHPSKKKSLHADFLTINIAARKKDKHLEHKYEQEGDLAKSLYYGTMQKTRKVANNSLSGAYASKSTILSNPSAHYTLTSITRCVASIGNSITESIVAGNKHFRNANVTMNYLTAVVANFDRSVVAGAIVKFKIYIPTPEQIMESVIFSSERYWKDEVAEAKILEFLKTLDDEERCAVLYTNDLWHFKKYNESIMRNMLKHMIKYVPSGSVNHLEDIYKAPEGISTLAHFICMDDIKGMNVEYNKLLGTPILDALASTCRNISTLLIYYKPLISAFLSTTILPTSIAHIREMLRDSIVLSDTDSTCGSYDQWVKWYYGEDRFDTEAMSLAAAVMTINTQAMDHNIKQFARNMNIDPSRVDLLKMKNEFFWNVFVTANKNKHYFANTLVKEGNVYAKPKLELKGVHLIASNINQDLIKTSQAMMNEVMDKLVKGEKLEVYKYVRQVADIERDIKEKVLKGDMSVFKVEKIKTKDSYKKEEDKSPYLHHLLWESVFSEKYGSPGEPMYMVLKIPLLAKKRKDFDYFLANMSDVETKEKWLSFLDKFEKDESVSTFKAPVTIVGSKGIPEEVMHVVNYKQIITDNCIVFYNILEAIGFYIKPDMLVSEMGY